MFFFRTQCKPCHAMRRCLRIPCRCIERSVFSGNYIFLLPLQSHYFRPDFLRNGCYNFFEVSYKSTREVTTLIAISNLFQLHAVFYPAFSAMHWFTFVFLHTSTARLLYFPRMTMLIAYRTVHATGSEHFYVNAANSHICLFFFSILLV